MALPNRAGMSTARDRNPLKEIPPSAYCPVKARKRLGGVKIEARFLLALLDVYT